MAAFNAAEKAEKEEVNVNYVVFVVVVKLESRKGVVHKWRQAILDNYWSPLPIVTLFCTIELEHIPLPRLWSHL